LLIEKNPYEVLDLRPTATQKQIRTKYRLLVQKYHPDLHPGDTAAALLMGQVNSAYDILGNPKTRRRYDEKLNASTGAAEATEAQAEEAQQPFEKTEEQTSYEEVTEEETIAAEEWAARESQARQEKGFVSSVWAEVTDLQPQEYADGWVKTKYFVGLSFRVVIAIFVLLLRFLSKRGDEDEDFLKF
jgi:curved DNA-binding protein CbpA